MKIYSWNSFLHIYSLNSSTKKDVTEGLFLSEVQLVWIQYSFSKTGWLSKDKESSQLDNLTHSCGGRRDELLLFSEALVCSEMQRA